MKLTDEQIIANIKQINQLVYNVKLLIAYRILLNKQSNKNDSIIIEIGSQRFLIYNYPKKIERNSVIISFEIEIKKENETEKIRNLTDFTIKLLEETILLEFLEELKLEIDLEYIFELIRSIELTEENKMDSFIKYDYFLKYEYSLYNKIVITLADQYNRKLIAENKPYESTYILESNLEHILKEHIFCNYLNRIPAQIFNEVKEYIALDIFEIINLYYYGFLESIVNIDSTALLLNDTTESYRYSQITPFLWNMKFNNINMEKAIKFNRSYFTKDFTYEKKSNRIFMNGRFFFDFYSNKSENDYGILKDYIETLGINFQDYYEILLSKNFTDYDKFIKSNEDIGNYEKIKKLFGIRISQFAIGQLTINETLDDDIVEIDLRIRNPDLNLGESDKYDLILFNASIYIKDILNTHIVNFIQKLYDYLKEIFYVYPLHSKVIGNSDILYYFKLYDHFPYLRDLKVPLVENIEILKTDKPDDRLKQIIEMWKNRGDIDVEDFQKRVFDNILRNTDILEQLHKKDYEQQLDIEISKLKQYLTITKDFHHKIGMDFSELRDDFLRINYPEIERMPKYSKNSYIRFEKIEIENYDVEIEKMLKWCVENEFYFEINYIIENIIKISQFGNSYLDNFLKWREGHSFNFMDNEEKFYIFYSIEAFNIPDKFLGIPNVSYKFIKNSGINFLFISKFEKTIAIKLNETEFNESEISYLNSIFKDKYGNKVNTIKKGIDFLSRMDYPNKIVEFGIIIDLPIDVVYSHPLLVDAFHKLKDEFILSSKELFDMENQYLTGWNSNYKKIEK